MGTAKAQSLRCFSRTQLDDGTQLTGCTQPPGNLGLAPHHRDRRPCTTCVVAGHQRQRFPWTKTQRPRRRPRRLARSFQA
jgi:hypothetical protein